MSNPIRHHLFEETFYCLLFAVEQDSKQMEIAVNQIQATTDVVEDNDDSSDKDTVLDGSVTISDNN